MRTTLAHPTDRSGGSEIAGNWPPAWVAHLADHRDDNDCGVRLDARHPCCRRGGTTGLRDIELSTS